jgi:DNA-binding NarL/FixJ family response regulator
MRFWHECGGTVGAEAGLRIGSTLEIQSASMKKEAPTPVASLLSHFGEPAATGDGATRAPHQGVMTYRRDQDAWLLAEIEAFLAMGRPELAAERLVGILSAGMEAAMANSAPRPSRPAPANLPPSSILTRREREVTRLIVAGCTNRCIAEELFIAQSTVERHVANILNKLGFNSRTQIAAWAVQNGLAAA